MKKVIFLFATVLLFATSNSYSQGIDVFQGKFEKALKKAKTDNKIVFVDFFTTW